MRDEAFLRVGDEDRRLSFDQRVELRSTTEATPRSKRRWRGPTDRSRHSTTTAWPATHSGSVIRTRVGCCRPATWSLPTARLSPPAMLLFGTRPQRMYPEAYVRVLRYSGKERLTGTAQNLVSDVRCEGRLPQQIDAAREAVHEALPKQKSLGADGRFGWFDIVPEEVWLEALVNAVIHRAYSNFGDHIRIATFDDRVEVTSPGRFPGVASAPDLTDVPRFARNPRIARVMADLDYGQELGEGLRRMATVMEASGRRRPVLRQTAGGVRDHPVRRAGAT